MNCEQVRPYLPGVARGELGHETSRWVEAHVQACDSCRADTEHYRVLAADLAAIASRPIDPPPFLVETILERVRPRRRYLPVPPLVPAELARIAQENREVLTSAGAVVLAAGAAYALWRAARSFRPPRPAGA